MGRPPCLRWARDHKACTRCGTTDHRHAGFGLCVKCKYNRGIYRSRPTADIVPLLMPAPSVGRKRTTIPPSLPITIPQWNMQGTLEKGPYTRDGELVCDVRLSSGTLLAELPMGMVAQVKRESGCDGKRRVRGISAL